MADAVIVDTTEMTLEEVVDHLKRLVEAPTNGRDG